MASLGILSDPSIPLPFLLDAINHAEVGHLPRNQQLTVVSDAGAQGPYQFLTKNLHDMGYGMPLNIPVSDIQDYKKSRALAGQYVTGFSEELGFKTPLEQLVAYTAGPQFAADWVARGAHIEELGPRTQSYIKRAAQYLNDNFQPDTQDPPPAPAINTGDQQMAMNAAQPMQFGQPIDPNYALHIYQRAAAGDPQAIATLNTISNMPRGHHSGINPEQAFIAAQDAQMAATPSNAPKPVLAEAGNNTAVNPQFFGHYQDGALSETPANNNNNGGGGLLSTAAYADANDGFQPVPTGDGPRRIEITDANSMMRPAISMPTPTYRDNRRDKAVMSLAKPKSDINDLLIAMGAAGLRGSAEGGLQGLAGMGEAYTRYKAAEQDALAKYNAALAKAQGKGGKGGSAMSGVIVNDALNRVDPLLNAWTTGFGSYLKVLPTSDAKKVQNLLATIKGNIGFDKLQAMRDASPTGGALGQVSERELTFLQSVFGSLEQDQNAEDLRYNLGVLRYVYNSIIHGEGNHPYQMPDRTVPLTPGTTHHPRSAGALEEADKIVGIN